MGWSRWPWETYFVLLQQAAPRLQMLQKTECKFNKNILERWSKNQCMRVNQGYVHSDTCRREENHVYTCKVHWDARGHKMIMIQRHDWKQYTLEGDWLWQCHLCDVENHYSALFCTWAGRQSGFSHCTQRQINLKEKRTQGTAKMWPKIKNKQGGSP